MMILIIPFLLFSGCSWYTTYRIDNGYYEARSDYRDIMKGKKMSPWRYGYFLGVQSMEKEKLK